MAGGVAGAAQVITDVSKPRQLGSSKRAASSGTCTQPIGTVFTYLL
jgi:hypothetical protein